MSHEEARLRDLIREMVVFELNRYKSDVRIAVAGIVREEMERAHVTQTGYIETGLHAGDVVGKKPKTDLERAAEVADVEERIARRAVENAATLQPVCSHPHAEGRAYAAHCIAREIRALKPSPDWEAQATRWRKIAEGLYNSLKHSRSMIGLPEALWQGAADDAIEAYKAAVKESQ